MLKLNGIPSLKWRNKTLEHDPRSTYGSNIINFGEIHIWLKKITNTKTPHLMGIN